MIALSGSLDANILLRWLLADITAQTSLVDRLLSKGDEFYVSDLAIIEVGFILEKELSFSRSLVAENMLQIINHGALQTNRKLFSAALGIYLKHPKLSLVDCCLATYAKQHNALPLFTFDK